MPVDIESFSKFIAAAVEDNEGVEQSPLKLYRTRNLSPDIYAGNTKKREYNGDDGRNQPTVMSGQHNKLSFDFDFAGSGDISKVPEIDDLLRIGGLNRVANSNGGWDYLIADSADVDSGTFMLRRLVGRGEEAGEKRYYRYPILGARGYLGIEWKVDEDPLFKLTDIMGQYIRPISEEITEIKLVYPNQADPLPIGNDNTPTAKIDGKDVCLNAMTISNYSGFDVNYTNNVNCNRTRLKPKAIDGTMTIKEPDWINEFHIYEMVESHQRIMRVPLLLEHGTKEGNKQRIESQQIQIHGVKDTDMPDGSLGKELSFTFLDKPILTLH